MADKLSKAQINAQEQLLELLTTKNEVLQKSSQLLFDQIEASSRLSSKQKDQVKTLNLISNTEKSTLHINDKLNVLKSRASQVTDKTLETSIKKLKVEKAATGVIQDQAEATMKGLKAAISMMGKVPGGGLLIGMMGLGPENMKILQDNIADVRAGVKDQSEVLEGLPLNFKKMAVAGLALGAVVGIFGMMKKAVGFVAGMIDELGASFGAVATRSDEFKNTMMDASVEVISIGKATKDVVEVTQELSQNFGLSFNEAAKMSDKILDSAVGMGMSNSEAAKLFGTFMSLGGLSLEQAENLAESTYQLAAQNGVAPVAVMKDISESSEMIAKFGAANLESITKAAIQARKMGLNLSTVTKISDSLLDFQSSIQAEMEASVMIGRTINLNEARRLNFAGKTDEAFQSVLKQMGGIDKFEKLGVLQRRALAKSIGLESTELAKLIRNQGKSIEQQKTFNDIMGKEGLSSLTSLINKITELGKTFLMEFGKPLEALLAKFEKNFLNEEGMKNFKGKMENMGKMITEPIEKAKKAAKVTAALGGAYAGLKLGLMSGNPFVAAGGAIVGGVAGYMGAGSVVDDFQSSGGSHLVVTPDGRKLETNPRDTVFGTTSVNDFSSGPMGSLMGGEETNQELKKLNENIEILISETKRTSGNIVSGIGAL